MGGREGGREGERVRKREREREKFVSSSDPDSQGFHHEVPSALMEAHIRYRIYHMGTSLIPIPRNSSAGTP